MAITNPNHKTRLLGFSIPNIFLYGIILLMVFVIYKVGNIFSMIFKKIANAFGLGGNESLEKNHEAKESILKNNPTVLEKSNTYKVKNIADRIDDSIRSMPYDINALYQIFDSITGPNEMGAISLAFGKRSFTWIPFISSYNGDLTGALKTRLWSWQLNKSLKTQNAAKSLTINSKLNWLNSLK